MLGEILCVACCVLPLEIHVSESHMSVVFGHLDSALRRSGVEIKVGSKLLKVAGCCGTGMVVAVGV